MPDIPKVSLDDWITIGKKVTPVSGTAEAVVCNIYDALSLDGGHIEVVYLDYRKRAINEDAKWVEDHWEFAQSGPCGGYADKYPRIGRFVQQLRSVRK